MDFLWLWGIALLEEVHPWKQALRLYSIPPLSFFSPLLTCGWRCVLSAFCYGCLLPCLSHHYRLFSEAINPNKLPSVCCLCSCIYHSSRQETKTKFKCSTYLQGLCLASKFIKKMTETFLYLFVCSFIHLVILHTNHHLPFLLSACFLPPLPFYPLTIHSSSASI